MQLQAQQVPSNLIPEQSVTPENPVDPDAIIRMADQRFMDFEPLYTRMDTDYRAFRLDAFKPAKGEAIEDKDAYTSNAPYTLAKQVISYVTSSELIIQVPNRRADEQKREANQALEQFLLGIRNLVDDQFQERADPRLIAQLAAFAVIRGPVVMRRLLKKDEYGETVPDALVMDPRWVTFQRDSRGYRWVCYKVRKARDEVSDIYEVVLPSKENKDDGGMYCYDMYWRRKDGTFANGMLGSDGAGWLKPPAPVYSQKFPIVIVGGDDLPMLQAGDTGEKTIAQWAESVFAANRNQWAVDDRAASYLLALTARSVDQVMKLYSNEGNKTLDENPAKKGGLVQLSRQNNEELEPLKMSETTHDAQMFMSLVAQNKDIGGLPKHAFGLSDTPMSGVAMRQLGARIDHIIRPFVNRVEQAVKLATDGWCADFKTGSFRPIVVYGTMHNKQPFELEATPDIIQMAGKPLIRLVPKLPEDTLEKVQIAKTLTEADPRTGERIMSYAEVRDHVLDLQDAQWTGNQVREEMAETGSPFAMAMSMAQSAFKAGNQDLAKYYLKQAGRVIQKEQLEDEMMFQQAMMAGQPPQVGGEGQPALQSGANGAPKQAGGPQVDPRIMGPSRTGQNYDTASPDAGYATRNARPGGQSERTRRLNSIGIQPEQG